jgi:Ca2+:H+ antiporter
VRRGRGRGGGGRGFAASFALGCVIVGEEAGGIFDARSLSFPPSRLLIVSPPPLFKKKTYPPPPLKGDTIGGLINATFGNVVEMILTVSALRRGLYQVVSFSLVGSILSNMLMVLGFCYLVGGLIYAEQRFSTLANKAFCSLLFMACIALLVPTSVSIFYDDRVMPPSSVLALSRATAVVMLCIYGAYLYFTLGTHSAMVVEDARVSALATRASSTAAAIGGGARSGGAEEEEGEEEVPQVSLLGATLSLSLLTAVIAVASEALTGSIETVTARTGISTAFISVIILPIAGNAAEHLTAVVVAAKGKMDLAQSIALGSSLQISMLALPFAVLAAW